MRMGKNFGEFDSNNTAMIVVEGREPLGEAAHRLLRRRRSANFREIPSMYNTSRTSGGIR